MSNSFSASLTLLESRLTAARAGYLDNLSGGAVALASVMSATRGGYLDNLSGGAVGLEATLGTIDNLVDDLETRLTATRAGYLDKLNIAGSVAGATPLATVDTVVDANATAIAAIPTANKPTVQRGLIVLASTYANQAATITAVTTANAELRFCGFLSAENSIYPHDVYTLVKLTNTTTVTASRSNGGTYSCTASWEISGY